MRIAIVGPTHPYKGGIAQETTELAHRLSAVGHSVELLSWKAMYPKLLYPGNQFVPADKPELPTFEHTRRTLSWRNPTSWWRHVRKLRGFDQVIFIWWVPTIQGPVYLTMLRALGKRGPQTILICHNVLPHEPRPGDRAITRAVLRRVNRIIVHTQAQAEVAKTLTSREIRVVGLPLALPGRVPEPTKQAIKLKHRLLFFGIVREYKGLDVLLRALAQVPNVKLTVAGEFWESERYERLITELDLEGRVTLRKGYLPADELAGLFTKVDALVLPYRGGTASQHVAIAHTYGVPVIATTAASMAQQVHDGVDGLLCRPDDVDDLTETIKHFYEPGVATKLRKGVPHLSDDRGWGAYLQTLGA